MFIDKCREVDFNYLKLSKKEYCDEA